jgi:hypothetical protein
VRYDSRHDAQTLRGKALGPVALMQRRAIQPFVPDRGTLNGHVRNRQRSFRGFGASSTVGDAAAGASIAGKAGSYFGPIGTAIGTIAGAVGGAIYAALNRTDPENANFNQAQQIADSQGPAAVLNIADKYLVLAGLFDLQPSQIKGNIPMYKKYGRMGEQRFVTDMINLVYTASQNGQITINDTAQSVFGRIVQPWMDSWGYGPMSDHNATMLQYILMGMIAEYFAGLQTRWGATGGDNPFTSLPPFSLPTPVQPLAPAPVSSPTPSPQPVTLNPAASNPTAVPSAPSELQRYLSGQLPTMGAAVGFARDASTNQFVAVPAGGQFAGLDAQNRWIITYPTGSYFVSNGILSPVQPASSSMGPTTAPSSPSVPTMAPEVSTDTGNASQSTSPAIVSSGGYYPASPVTTIAPTSVAPTASGGQEFPVWIAVGGVALLAIIMLNKKGR